MENTYELKFGKYRITGPFEFMRDIGYACGGGTLKPMGDSVFEITTKNPIPDNCIENYRNFGMIIEECI